MTICNTFILKFVLETIFSILAIALKKLSSLQAIVKKPNIFAIFRLNLISQPKSFFFIITLRQKKHLGRIRVNYEDEARIELKVSVLGSLFNSMEEKKPNCCQKF